VVLGTNIGGLANFYNTTITAVLLMSLGSLVLIVFQTNPVYAVFSFIITALITSLLCLLVGAEFFALLILIIYIGVIAVLFIFVVIMYNFQMMSSQVSPIAYHPVVAACLYKCF
jgi:NADH-quinone oxidoreductase subunit J